MTSFPSKSPHKYFLILTINQFHLDFQKSAILCLKQSSGAYLNEIFALCSLDPIYPGENFIHLFYALFLWFSELQPLCIWLLSKCLFYFILYISILPISFKEVFFSFFKLKENTGSRVFLHFKQTILNITIKNRQ